MIAVDDVSLHVLDATFGNMLPSALDLVDTRSGLSMQYAGHLLCYLVKSIECPSGRRFFLVTSYPSMCHTLT